MTDDDAGRAGPLRRLLGTVLAWFTGRPRRLAAIGGVGGLAMIGVGVSVAATGRHD